MASNNTASLDKTYLSDLAWSELQAPRSILICILVLIVTTAAWRRFFSPLKHVPGPFWASITRLWYLKAIIEGNQNEQLQQMHDKYGKFVRLAPNEISVTHPDAVKKLLLTTLPKVIYQLLDAITCLGINQSSRGPLWS